MVYRCRVVDRAVREREVIECGHDFFHGELFASVEYCAFFSSSDAIDHSSFWI
jgi:hypothetical protein